MEEGRRKAPRTINEMTPAARNAVAAWLLAGCFLVFVMVVVGGITRLTGSGLSITEWQPIMGAIPPLNDAQWHEAFEKYQQIPQFQKVNQHFTLDEFKSIFWWEFIHRLIGRVIGLVFIAGFIWFLLKKVLTPDLVKKTLFLFLLGGLQGFIGWFMVQSGLSERTSVSHIRLAIHLMTAFITFGFTFYFALQVLTKRELPSKPSKNFIRNVNIFFILLSVQIIYGAFVAGLHAGRIYNTFPLMDGKLVPAGAMAFSPAWLNFTDNPATVQFIHRILGITLFVIAVVLPVSTDSKDDRIFKKAGMYILLAVSLQFLLGMFTLLSKLDITLAILHQSGAFFVFAMTIWLLFLVRKAGVNVSRT